MFEQSLDISLIRSQPTEKAKQTLFDKDASLENILDELEKRDNPSKKKNPTPYIEIPKNPAPIIRSSQNKHSIATTADHTPSSSDYDTLARKVQTTRRESKLLVVSQLPSAVRPSIEIIHDMPEKSAASPNKANEDSPLFPPNMQRRGSNLLGTKVDNGLMHVRRMSSPHVLGLFQSQAKLVPISSSMAGSQTSLIPSLSQMNNEPPRFNISIPEKPQVTSSPKLKLVTAYSVNTNSPKSPYIASPAHAQMKVDSPMQGPINSDYLIRVLQKSGLGNHPGSHGGSYPGSASESPKSEGNHDGFRNIKRGSFSVFRKVVEAELKNP